MGCEVLEIMNIPIIFKNTGKEERLENKSGCRTEEKVVVALKEGRVSRKCEIEGKKPGDREGQGLGSQTG